MAPNTVLSHFAPPEREPSETLHAQSLQVSNDAIMRAVVRAVPEVVLIVNARRQIVFANDTCLAAFGLTNLDDVLGKRPGELLQCVHSDQLSGGCGTTEFCQTCGAVRAIMTSLRGKEDVQECRISLKQGDALDLRVWTSPLTVDGEPFSIFTMKDIGDEKRRAALERIFFHDVLNTASLITSYGSLIEEEPDSSKDLIGDLNHAAVRLISELNSQRQILSAERGDLHTESERIDADTFLEVVCREYSHHILANCRYVRVEETSQSAALMTDPTVLGRVISNMVKNAIEASNEGDTITLSYSLTPMTVVFSVHNPSVMPRDVQLQVFNRSFSTKGLGRGLGTYSMKLLSERYLHGRVWFQSETPAGTTFFAEFPRL